MSHTPPSQDDIAFLVFVILLTVMFIYQSWTNLIKKELSKFSIDALVLFLATSFGGRKYSERARRLSRDPKRILFFGIYGILGALGGIYGIMTWIKTIYGPR